MSQESEVAIMQESESKADFSLILASQIGQIETVTVLLDHGAQVDLQDKDGWSALMAASLNGHTETVKVLLRHGAQVDLQEKDGWTALMIATLKGDTKTVKVLLDFNAQVNLKNNIGWFALMIASRKGHTETAKALLEHGAQVDLQNNIGWSALMIAHQNDHNKTVQVLLDHGAQSDIKDRNKCFIITSTNVMKAPLQHDSNVDPQVSRWSTLLKIMACNGWTKEVKRLLKYGENVDFQDNNGDTALMITSSNGHTETVKVLLDHSAQVNLQNNNGWSALMIASQKGHTETVKVLLDHGAQVDLQNNKNGWSALTYASWDGYTKIAKVLLDYGAQVNLQDIKGWSALIVASENGHIKTIKVLLDHGAQVDLQNSNEQSALIIASQHGHAETVKMLIDHGAQVDLPVNKGWSALMIASQDGYVKTVKVLLDHNAQVDLQNNDGWSALMVASKNGRTETVKVQLDHGAQVDLQNNIEWSALMIASLNGHTKTITILLDHGAQVLGIYTLVSILSRWAYIFQDIPPFLYNVDSCDKRYTEILQLLLKHDPKQVDSQDDDGMSALMIASSFEKRNYVEILLDHGAQVDLQTKSGATALMMTIFSKGFRKIILLSAFLGIENTIGSTLPKSIEIDSDKLKYVKNLLRGFMSANKIKKPEDNETLVRVLSVPIPAGEVTKVKINYSLFEDMMKLIETNLPTPNNETIEVLLERGAQVNLQDNNGISSLMLAVDDESVDIVALLLKHHAKVDLQQKNGLSALMIATRNGHSETVQVLLKHGACVDLQENNGWTALMIATLNGHSETVEVLINHDVQVDLQNNNGWSALMVASTQGHTETVKILLDHGAQVDLQDNNGLSALMIASGNGHIEIVKLLLDHSAQIDLKNKFGWSCLMMAIVYKRIQNMTQFYLNIENTMTSTLPHTIEIDTVSLDYIKKTILGYVSNYKGPIDYKTLAKVVSIPKPAGSNTKVPIESSIFREIVKLYNTANFFPDIAAKGHAEIIEILLERDAQASLKEIDGLSPLMLAIYSEQPVDIIELLLKHGAQVNSQTEDGVSALMLATISGNIKLLQVLLDHRAEVNLKTSNELSALIIAVDNGQTEIVKTLIAAHNCQIDQGAIVTARLNGHEEILDLLQKKKKEDADQLKTTVAHTAVQNNTEVSEQLIKREVKKGIAELTKAQTEMMSTALQNTEQMKAQFEEGIKITQCGMEQLKTQFEILRSKMEQMNNSISQQKSPDTGKLNASLNLRNIFKELLPLADRWKNIGALLGTPNLNVIQHNCNNIAQNCLQEMIETWLKMVDPEPTWEILVEAVKLIDPKKAIEITQKYLC